MTRETRELKTPVDEVKIEIKTYITGREYEEIEDIIYSEIKVSAAVDKGSQSAEAGMKDGSFMKKQTHKAIELLITSVNEKSEGVLEAVLDLKKEDYLFVISEIEKVTKDKGVKKK